MKATYKNTIVQFNKTVFLNCNAYTVQNNGIATATVNGIVLKKGESLNVTPPVVAKINWALDISFESEGLQNVILQEFIFLEQKTKTCEKCSCKQQYELLS